MQVPLSREANLVRPGQGDRRGRCGLQHRDTDDLGHHRASTRTWPGPARAGAAAPVDSVEKGALAVKVGSAAKVLPVRVRRPAPAVTVVPAGAEVRRVRPARPPPASTPSPAGPAGLAPAVPCISRVPPPSRGATFSGDTAEGGSGGNGGNGYPDFGGGPNGGQGGNGGGGGDGGSGGSGTPDGQTGTGGKGVVGAAGADGTPGPGAGRGGTGGPGEGGAIADDGTLTVKASTFESDTAEGGDGGLGGTGSSGGIGGGGGTGGSGSVGPGSSGQPGRVGGLGGNGDTGGRGGAGGAGGPPKEAPLPFSRAPPRRRRAPSPTAWLRPEPAMWPDREDPEVTVARAATVARAWWRVSRAAWAATVATVETEETAATPGPGGNAIGGAVWTVHGGFAGSTDTFTSDMSKGGSPGASSGNGGALGDRDTRRFLRRAGVRVEWQSGDQWLTRGRGHAGRGRDRDVL